MQDSITENVKDNRPSEPGFVRTVRITDLEYSKINLNEETIDNLTTSIDRVGLQNFPVITKNNRVVSGRHRIEALKRLNRDEVQVRILEFENVTLRKLARLQENIARNNFGPLEMSELILEEAQLLEKIGAASKHGGNRSGKMRKSQHESAAKQIAKSTGKSSRSVSEAMEIARNINQSVRDKIRSTPVAEKRDSLMRLAKTPEDKQEALAEKLIAEAKAKKEQPQKRKGKSSSSKQKPHQNMQFKPIEFLTGRLEVLDEINHRLSNLDRKKLQNRRTQPKAQELLMKLKTSSGLLVETINSLLSPKKGKI